MTDDKLHPRVGFVNPGTGPIEDAKEEYADQNIVQLIQDVGLEGITYRRDAPKDEEGRFAYQLNHDKKDVEIQMPGLPLENVRFLGEEGQSIFDFPRLYVNGGSWVWKYAIGTIRTRYEDSDEE